jgi:hypothetical protein
MKWHLFCNKSYIYCFLIFFVFSLHPGTVTAEIHTRDSTAFSGVDYKDGLLKISVETQRFQDIIDDVADKTGLEIVIISPIEEDISIDFDYLPLEDGLQKLLKWTNYVFFFSGGSAQKATLSQVLVWPCSKKSTGSPECTAVVNAETDHAGLTEGIKNNLYIDKQRMDETLNSFISSNEELRKKIDEAMQQIESSEGFERVKSKVEMLESEEGIKKIQEDISGIENKIRQ